MSASEEPRDNEIHDAHAYWNRVAERIAARPVPNTSAGDSSPAISDQSNRVVVEFIHRLPVAGRSVLEVGCGPGGKLGAVLSRKPGRLVGADHSDLMVRLARENLGPAGVEVVELERGKPYPFADREFDLVFTCTVLHHNPDEALPGILSEIARVADEDIVLIEASADRSFSAGESFHLREPRVYADLLAEHGFGLREVRPLRNYASELLMAFAMRVAHTRRLGREPYREGAPTPRMRTLIERAGLPVTRRIDPFVHQRSGLAALSFRRV